MRMTFFLALVVMNFSCTHKLAQKTLIPAEYNFPENQIGIGKTMTYVNSNTGDTTFINLFHKINNQDSFLTQQSYDKNSTSDSMVLVNHKLTEYYINPDKDGQLWKADKIYDTVIIDKAGKLTQVSEFHWQKNARQASVKNQTQIIKDTVFQWNGRSYPTIITKSTVVTNSNFLKTPEGEYSFEMEVTNYVSKYIGIVRRIIVCSWNDKPIITNLVEIRDVRS